MKNDADAVRVNLQICVSRPYVDKCVDMLIDFQYCVLNRYSIILHSVLSQYLLLQVKLSNQESDLVSLLKRLPLGPAELAVVREKAELLHRGQLKRGEAVLPVMLATFIFDVLCSSNGGTQTKRQATGKHCATTKEDEELGFQAALHAIGAVL